MKTWSLSHELMLFLWTSFSVFAIAAEQFDQFEILREINSQ